jgi:glycine cleavage system H protein
MADSLTFMMGIFEAVLPAERRYARNHMWCLQTPPPHPLPLSPGRERGEPVMRFGFTTYAVRLMQDVYFLDWEANPGDAVALKQKIGHIETSKAMSDLFAPIAGILVQFNPELLNDPSAINVDMYGNGWLFEMAGADADTLSVEEYHAFLAAGWEKTQNMLKGHM